MWEKKEVVQEKEYSIYYQSQDILGFIDIINSNLSNERTETINSEEDSCIIFVPKT